MKRLLVAVFVEVRLAEQHDLDLAGNKVARVFFGARNAAFWEDGEAVAFARPELNAFLDIVPLRQVLPLARHDDREQIAVLHDVANHPTMLA